MDFDIDFPLLYIHLLCESNNIYLHYCFNMYYNISHNRVLSNNTKIYHIKLCCMIIVLMVMYSLSIQYNIIYKYSNNVSNVAQYDQIYIFEQYFEVPTLTNVFSFFINIFTCHVKMINTFINNIVMYSIIDHLNNIILPIIKYLPYRTFVINMHIMRTYGFVDIYMYLLYKYVVFYCIAYICNLLSPCKLIWTNWERLNDSYWISHYIFKTYPNL